MQRSEKNLLNSSFSHVYIEKKVMDHPLALKILDKLTPRYVIPVEHYKDIFARRNQDIKTQFRSRQLILARSDTTGVYQGSEKCDPFGHPRFYYCVNAMNCIYNCEYCYLRGLYPCAYLVIFLDMEDVFSKTDDLLKEGPVFMCNSYETDLLAIEYLTGFVRRWIEFAVLRKDITLEIRTKSSAFDNISDIEPADNVILAWSLSPESIAERFEKGAPSPGSRIDAMKKALDLGWKVRLCIDPMLFVDNWEEEYEKLSEKIRDQIDISSLYDLSFGTFRTSAQVLKKMRSIDPYSVIASFPYERRAGGNTLTYPQELENEMICYIKELFR
jgi:spore photoproduct lyase